MDNKLIRTGQDAMDAFEDSMRAEQRRDAETSPVEQSLMRAAQQADEMTTRAEREDALIENGAEIEPVRASETTAADAGFDADDFETVTPDDADDTHLAALADQYLALTDKIESLSAQLETAKAARMELSRNTLSEVFTARKLTEYVAPDGRKLVVKEECHASVKKDDRARAATWLEQNGYGAILTHEFTIKLPAKSEIIAERMRKFLAQCLPTEQIEITVPPRLAQLSSALRTMLAEIAPGRQIDERLSWSGSSLGKIIRDRRRAGAPVPEWLGYFDPATVQLADEPLITE